MFGLSKVGFGLVGTMCMASFCQASGAVTTTVTFDDVALGGKQFGIGGNFESDGFRFSPCHNYGIVSSTDLGMWSAPPGYYLNTHGFNDSQYFVVQAGNGDGNPEYVGARSGCGYPRDPVGTSLFIDNFGDPFSLVSLYGPMLESFGITSSKGGVAFVDMHSGQSLLTFSGPEWVGVRWIEIAIGIDVPLGFDQITFTAGVPEPGSFALLGLGLMGLGFKRRVKVRGKRSQQVPYSL